MFDLVLSTLSTLCGEIDKIWNSLPVIEYYVVVNSIIVMLSLMSNRDIAWPAFIASAAMFANWLAGITLWMMISTKWLAAGDVIVLAIFVSLPIFFKISRQYALIFVGLIFVATAMVVLDVLSLTKVMTYMSTQVISNYLFAPELILLALSGLYGLFSGGFKQMIRVARDRLRRGEEIFSDTEENPTIIATVIALIIDLAASFGKNNAAQTA